MNHLYNAIGAFLFGMYIGVLPAAPLIAISCLIGEPKFWFWPFYGGLIALPLFVCAEIEEFEKEKRNG